MTEFERPANPFPVSEGHAENTFVLINAAVETFALLFVPIHGESPDRLVVLSAIEWVRRAAGDGDEDLCHALMWELSVWINRMATEGLPFAPFDISNRCEDAGCTLDHSRDMRAVNTLFLASKSGEHRDAIKAYVSRVRDSDHEMEPAHARVHVAAVLLVHTAERISEFRRHAVDHELDVLSLLEDPDPS